MMRTFYISIAAAAALASGSAVARDGDKTITNGDPDVEDVARTPINDLNVGRDDEIPPLLIAATQDPYAQAGLRKCRSISAAVEELDEILGPDIDLPQSNPSRLSSGRIAKTVVASFIPFRSLIREVSGANAQDKKVQIAIQAGLARRGFLKGLGAARGCKYPASPATFKVIAAYEAELSAQQDKKDEAKRAEERQQAGNGSENPSEKN